MAARPRDHGDPGLIAFVTQLLADDSLETPAASMARKLVNGGADSLSAAERMLIEREVVEPYLGDCEACHLTPDWSEVLHVYDTGLCTACFDKLAAVDIPAVRPDWMPMAPPPPEDDELPVAVAASTTARA